MKFVILKPHHRSQDRLLTKGIRLGDVYIKGENLDTIGVLITVTHDFDPNSEDVITVEETSSYQVRPKAVFLNKTGKYFYMLDNKRKHLTEDEVSELKEFINKINGLER